jgi:hypothetical protein
MMIERGKYVAILPSQSSPVADVLEIASVMLAGGLYVQLMDGRMYATRGGASLGTNKLTYIVPATDAHWAALRIKKWPAAVRA